MLRLTGVFVVSFFLNLVWENLHAPLYSGYRGGEITEFILVRASFWDAVIIILMLAPFLYVAILKKYTWLILAVGLCIAWGIEVYALGTSRWAYASQMPIIPLLNIGLTPALQLGLIGYLVFHTHTYLLQK